MNRDVAAVTEQLGAELDDREIAMLYGYPQVPPGRAWVRANMVASLDGAAAGEDGRSGSVNTAADRRVFALLRALADVVLVGAGTARIEGYRRPRVRDPDLAALRTGRAPHPSLAVVSRRGLVPPRLVEPAEAPEADESRDPPAAGSGDALLVTCAAAGADAIGEARRALGSERVIVAGDNDVDLAAAMGELSRRGLDRVLCEGGPHLLRDVAAAGLLDELCLTIVPRLVAGPQPRVLAGAHLAADLVPMALLESEGALLGRWSRVAR
jgi:riboflavin biosynthesis pyrimidine reductase